jgi:uncharacterized protein (DUF1330 family)
VDKQEDVKVKAFGVITVHDVRNAEGYDGVINTVGKSITDGGGKFLAGGSTELEKIIASDDDLQPERVTLIQFPDLETATDWWDNGGREEVDKLRESATLTVFFVEGLA